MGALEFITDILVISSAATLGIFLAGIFTAKYVYFPLLRKTREDHMEMIEADREERQNELDTAEFLERFTEEFQELEERSEDPPVEAIAEFATTLMTPVGEVTMIYHHETSAFHYYCDRRTVPVRFLDVVAQKFVIDHDCKRFYIREPEQSEDESTSNDAEGVVDSADQTYYSQFSSWFLVLIQNHSQKSQNQKSQNQTKSHSQKSKSHSKSKTHKKNPPQYLPPSRKIRN
jgi:hypothetical protein